MAASGPEIELNGSAKQQEEHEELNDEERAHAADIQDLAV